jgi:hypothetical protein
MQQSNKDFASYVANIRRVRWVGVAERQLSADLTQRIIGEWVHNPYEYTIATSGAYQINRLTSSYK